MGSLINVAQVFPALNETLVKIAEYDLHPDIRRLGIEVVNGSASAAAFDQCEVRAQVRDGSLDIVGAAGSFTTPVAPLIVASGNLKTLAAGATGSFIVDVGGLSKLSVWAATAAPVAATGVLTAAGNPANNDTVTIDGVTYTFVTALAAAYDVLIGALATNTLDNLIAAITGGAGEGSTYGTGTVAHPTVTAAAGAGDTVDVTALATGSSGNAIATTDVSANLSWGDPTLTGGVGLEDVTVRAHPSH